MLRLSLVILGWLGAIGPAIGQALPDDWAFKPVVPPVVPSVKASNAVRTPIDSFLLAKLEAHNLSFAPQADKATLLRRVTFDLTGLPPTPDELVAFMTDDTPNAYDKVVNRLLASPHFGERVALWWLDLVRFAETDGFRADDHRPNAWRYRDYVINSFNSDKPYSHFVMEQLAGDELFPDSPEALVATGFLRHYPDEFNAVNLEQRRQEILNDITDTTAAAFLGITLGCAKCHDHKTDPVSQYDYYRIQAFFAGVWPKELSLMSSVEQAEYEKHLHEWEAKTADLRLQMAQLERPLRETAEKKQRSRFPEEYVAMLDKPASQRTPLEQQIAAMIAKQVYSERRIDPKQMKPSDREKWEGMAKEMAELSREKPPEPALAMGMTDVGPVVPPTRFLKRGNWKAPAEELVPGFITVIDDRDADTPTNLSKTSGRRSTLAKWIAHPQNPLTARVLVNRIWQHLFDRGIVATPNDFGVAGERPTHPELLDWLATEFIRNDWSVKYIYRLIVTSTVYQQSARGSDAGAKVDPENTLLWQMPRKRLDGETLRDAMLAVSGTLNPQAGGPSIFPELPAELRTGAWKVSTDPAERNRRSVYVYVKRNLRYPLFALFDSPDRTETCGRRFVTTTAPQALTLLNDEIVLEMAKAFAQRVMTDDSTTDQVIDRTFALALTRKPTTEERETVRAFFAKRGGLSTDSVTDFCHAMFNINEFIYIE
jgi:hypothetical protein